MADDAQKSPLVKSLQLYTQAMMDHFFETLSKSFPATVESVDSTGTVVTVNIEVQDPVQKFPRVTCPVSYPPFVRYPLKKGSPGFIVGLDAYLGGVSGLGGGVATLAPQGNLTAVSFLAVGGPGLGDTDDPQAQVLYGPNGVILRDENKLCVFTLTPEGIQITLDGVNLMSFSSQGVTLQFGGKSISITEAGIDINGQTLTTIDGHLFLPHTHIGVQAGPDDTGAVSP